MAENLLKGKVRIGIMTGQVTVLVSCEKFEREDFYAKKKQKCIGAYDGR